MKLIQVMLVLAILILPFTAYAGKSFTSPVVSAIVLDNGNWQLTDKGTGVTWHGEWQSGHVMKVVGSDNSCFVIGENKDGMVQLDCKNLKEISVLLSYSE